MHFWVQHFHAYLFGHFFELVTDHQPLPALMSEHRPMLPQASARVQRWTLLLSVYEHSLHFRRTEAHANADALSQLPLPTAPNPCIPPELLLLMQHIDESPVTADQIRAWI